MSAGEDFPGRDSDVFRPPRLRLTGYAVGCLAAAAVFYLPTTAPFPSMVWFGWTMIVVLVVSAVWLVARVARPGPTVVIGRAGILDRTTLSAPVALPWEEIAVVRKKEIGRGWGAERLLEVVVADPAAYRARPRGWVRGAIERYRRGLKQPEVAIPGSMVSMPLQAVMDSIRRHRPELEVLAGPPPAPSKRQLLFRSRKTPQQARRPELPRW